MEFDEMRTAWKAAAAVPATNGEIRRMLGENRHPVLKSIRTQAVIEVAGWSAFLLCYYSMFDGAGKPVFIHVVLIMSLTVSLGHNLFSYVLAKNLVTGPDLAASLVVYIRKIRVYTVCTLLARALFMFGLILFFTYRIHFNLLKYGLLSGIGIIFILQLFLLYRIWAQRLKRLRQTLLTITE